MLGYYNRPGAPNSATLSGQIDPGGNAALIVQGLTGDTSHTVGHVHEGSPFNYSVTAHFDSRHGTGKRNEARDCALDFVRR